MSPSRDRLSSMVAAGPAAAPVAPAETSLRPSRRRALLFAPPPAPAAAYLSLLEHEGYDVLLAQDRVAADALLRSAPPHLILAVAPALGSDLVKAWQAQAPGAEVRVVSGLLPLIEERVVPPAEMIEFTVKALAMVSGLLASTRSTPRERALRTVTLAEGAARQLGYGTRELLSVRLSAALREVPDALGATGEVNVDTVTVKRDHAVRRLLLAQFAEGVGTPVPIAEEPPSGPRAHRKPVPEEVVDAAAVFARVLEAGGDGDPALALRRLAVGDPAELHPAAVEAVLAAHGAGRRAARGTVLVAEPDAGLRNLLALRLVNEGYEVRSVADGRSALEEIRKHAPGLVLAEAVLPGLDGYALLDTLNREGKRRLPFVFMSARTDSLSMNKGLLLGAADFLAKPLNVEVLLTKLQKIMGESLQQSELSARISLSDVTGFGTSAFPVVTYDEIRPGVLIQGRFRVESDLGEGGMGKVFRARDERLEETVVLKVMKTSLTHDDKILEHFKREIRLARRITHPGVVRIHDFWEAGPLNFVTMEYLEGTDLREEVKRRGAFPLPVAVRLGVEIFEALAAAHAVGVVHRDMKPHNVVLLPSGRIKVLDFGIAQGLDSSGPDGGTITGSVIGTPEYMSPEQLMGERVDARTDLYSAGVLFYELLTGQLPFRGPTRAATASMHLSAKPQPPSTKNKQVPAAVDAIVLKLLSKDREERFPTARAAATELSALRR